MKKYNKDWAMWKYLKHFQNYSNNKNITPKDIFYAMNYMINNRKIERIAPDTSIKQLDYLWDRLMGDHIDSYYLKDLFFKLVQESIDSRNEINFINNSQEDNESDILNPEEDMDIVSQELLKQDDVFYEQSNNDFLSSYREFLFETFKL